MSLAKSTLLFGQASVREIDFVLHHEATHDAQPLIVSPGCIPMSHCIRHRPLICPETGLPLWPGSVKRYPEHLATSDGTSKVKTNPGENEASECIKHTVSFPTRRPIVIYHAPQSTLRSKPPSNSKPNTSQTCPSSVHFRHVSTN